MSFLALIGEGSFSKVLRVSHRATGQRYAIKMIEKLSNESKKSCDKELRVLRRTRHQNIIQLIEIYEGTLLYTTVFQYIQARIRYILFLN